MSKIIDVMWFCAGHGNAGIVKVLDEYEGIKYYLGACPGEERGHNEEEDKQWIADWGSSFPKEAGDVLFGEDALRNGSAVQIPKNKDQAILMYQLGKNYLGLNDEA